MSVSSVAYVAAGAGSLSAMAAAVSAGTNPGPQGRRRRSQSDEPGRQDRGLQQSLETYGDADAQARPRSDLNVSDEVAQRARRQLNRGRTPPTRHRALDVPT
jgi:hypothetical protein